MFGAIPAAWLARYTSSSRAAAVSSGGMTFVQPSSPKEVPPPASLLWDQKDIWPGVRVAEAAGGGEAGVDGAGGGFTET